MAEAARTAPITADAQERYYLSSQTQLMWRKFKRHRLAMAAALLLALFYLAAILAELIAPYRPDTRFTEYIFTPPQRIRMIDPPAGCTCARSSTACSASWTWTRWSGSTPRTTR